MKYPYLSGDGVPVARPLFQEEGDGAIPISPLQLYFTTCSVPTAMQLNAIWHSRLPKTNRGNIDRNRRKCCYTAEFANRFYAVAIWTDPVSANRLKNGSTALELRRLAIANNAPHNTASRFISWMVKDIRKRFPDVTMLVSYQDEGVHRGTIYKAAGWHIGRRTEFMDWSTADRQRNAMQSDASKIRWELYL